VIDLIMLIAGLVALARRSAVLGIALIFASLNFPGLLIAYGNAGTAIFVLMLGLAERMTAMLSRKAARTKGPGPVIPFARTVILIIMGYAVYLARTGLPREPLAGLIVPLGTAVWLIGATFLPAYGLYVLVAGLRTWLRARSEERALKVEPLGARNRPRVIDTGPLVVRSRPKVIDIRPQVQPTTEGTGARSQTDVGPGPVETGPLVSGVSRPSTVRPTKALREVAVAQQRAGVVKESLQKKAFDAIIDGSNVAYYGGTNPTLRNVALVARRFSELGLSWVVIVDASLKYKLPQAELPSEFVMTLIGENAILTERETLERAIRKRERVHEAPAKRAADEFILEYARKWNAVVISNDKFEEYVKRFPDVLERRVTFMILEGEVAFSPDPLEVLSKLRGTSAVEQVSTGSDQPGKDGSVHSAS
jgi:hypothetical protein